MPAFNRVVVGGKIGTDEEWSCGFHFSTPGGFAAIDDQTELTNWAATIRAYITGSNPAAIELRSMLSTALTVETVRAYYYSSTTGPAERVAEATGAAVSGGGTVRLVPQCAAVFSLLTGIPGRRNRGRVYWPACGLPIAANFRIPTTDQGEEVSAMAAFIAAMRDAAPGALELVPVVVSRVADGVTPVTSVSLGDIIDTQRRRRESLSETRLVAAVP